MIRRLWERFEEWRYRRHAERTWERAERHKLDRLMVEMYAEYETRQRHALELLTSRSHQPQD